MKQLTQKLKDGQMQVLEVPLPMISPGMIMVRSHYSFISAGTEGSTVSAARKSLIGKAKERPQQVKQVLDVLKQQGPVQTYRAVMKKLDAYSPLGYSSSGEVIAVAPDVDGFSVGDLVACGGAGYANHSEVIVAPKNLCVKLPPDADMKKAAYNTLGAIAMQGVRQADLKIAETCAVIGLGLLGQLTCLLLRASGVKVVGVDIDPDIVNMAGKHAADLAFERNEPGLTEKIVEFTEGMGVDSVIITAATNSEDPVNLAGKIARKKASVIIVGAVPTGFERDDYYKKELELKMSCSYGPGRYDINYEEKGIDYPAGYVRWSENRNMKAFQELVHSGKVEVEYLTSHVFKLEDAPSAYDIIMNRNETFSGILIEYDVKRDLGQNKIIVQKRVQGSGTDKVSIAFVGAGSYAMNNLLPNIPKCKDVSLKTVMTSTGTSSRSVAERYGFEFCTSDESEIFNKNAVNTAFIATRHNTHMQYVMKALTAGQNVFVEKPLCLTEEELHRISEMYKSKQEEPGTQINLMVGYNRRFSSLISQLMKKVGKGMMSIIYRVNAGHIKSDSWIQDKEIGGGRIIGEVCHFVDLMTHINGSLPVHIAASAMSDPEGIGDTVNVNIKFGNGSIGTIAYVANGSKSFFKEYIEVHRAGISAVIKDFKELEIFGSGKPLRKKLISQDKGQKQMVETFINTIRTGTPSPITFEEIYASSIATFKIIESIKTSQSISI